jgi:hypothetical protein
MISQRSCSWIQTGFAGLSKDIDLRALVQKLTKKLNRFVAMVEAGYNECIYHNGLHAADVTHALHCLLDCQVIFFNFTVMSISHVISVR